MDRMEHSIGSIVSKIDAVLLKLESMESGRAKRKARMSKILGTITEDDSGKYTILTDTTLRIEMYIFAKFWWDFLTFFS